MRDTPAPNGTPYASRVLDWSDERRAGDGIIITLAKGFAFEPSEDENSACHVRGFDTVTAAKRFAREAFPCSCQRCTGETFEAIEESQTMTAPTETAARLAAQFTLDRDWKGETARNEIMYKSPTRYTAHGLFVDHVTGKRYAVEILHSKRGELDVNVWLNGRALPESHRLDIRQLAKAAYCEAFELRAVVVLGLGTRYRPIAAVSVPFDPSPAVRAAMSAELSTYRGN